MQAHMIGIVCRVSSKKKHSKAKLTIQDLWKRLESKSGKIIRESDSYSRILCLSNGTKWVKGLVVTAKNRTTLMTLKKGDRTIDLRAIARGEALVETNFFVINKNTEKGLYLSYHNSCSVLSFGTIITQEFREMLKSHHKDYVDQLISKGDAESTAKKAASRIYPLKGHNAQVTYIMSDKDAIDLARDMKRIKAFKYVELITTQTPKKASFWPSGQKREFLEKVTKKVKFTRGATPSDVDLAGWIKTAEREDTLESAAFYCVDRDDLSRTIALAENKASFRRYDLDQLLGPIDEIDLEDFTKVSVYSKMIEIASATPRINRVAN